MAKEPGEPDSGDEGSDHVTEQPARSSTARRDSFYLPDNEIARDIELLRKHDKVVRWGIRFLRLIEEYGTPAVLDTVTIWDLDVMTQIRSFTASLVDADPLARELLDNPRAKVSHLSSMEWWRTSINRQLSFKPINEFSAKPLSTIRRPKTGEVPQPPISDDEGSDHESDERRRREEEKEEAERRRRESTGVTNTSRTTDSDPAKKIKKESLGVFHPGHPDDVDNRGLVTTSTGKIIYTDVHTFCEHVQLFKRYGNYVLTDHYLGMLAGNASAWLMAELDHTARHQVLNASITEFCQILTKRFKRTEAELVKELHQARYTPRQVENGVTLAQWAQRKAGIAKQLGQKETSIVHTLFNLIDPEISRFLSHPDDDTKLTDFIKQCEDRRAAIRNVVKRSSGSNSSNGRNRQDYAPSSYDSRPRDDRPRDNRSSRGYRSYDGGRSSNSRGNRNDRYRGDNRDEYKAQDKDRRQSSSRDDDRQPRPPREGDYIRREQQEKKVHFEKKYQAIETPQPEPDDRGHDEQGLWEQDCPDPEDDGYESDRYSTYSYGSQDAYLVVLGDTTPNGSRQETSTTKPCYRCSKCKRSFPSRALLREHGNLDTCIKPQQLKEEEQILAKPKRCQACFRDFPSRNKLHKHLRQGCEAGAEPLNGYEAVTSSLFKPVPRTIDGSYTHLRFPAKADRNGPTVSVCADTGCGKPVVSRRWLETLKHSIETKPPVYIRGVNDVIGKPHTEWATFSFFVDGTRKDGSEAGTAEFSCGAWVQDGLPPSGPAALLGNAWMVPYDINVLNTEGRLECKSLTDFYIPFDVFQVKRKVSRRVIAARPMTVPAGETRLIPAAWKELPKDRSFAFFGTTTGTVGGLIDRKSTPGVVFVNDTSSDVQIQRKQKLGNIEECDDQEVYFSTTWKSALGAVALSSFIGVANAAEEPAPTPSVESDQQPKGALQALSSSFELTPDVAAVASGEVDVKSTAPPVTMMPPVSSLGEAILADIADATKDWKQRKRQVVSNMECFLAAESEMATPTPPDVDSAVDDTADIPSPVPYQTQVQRQPNLSEVTLENGMHIYADDQAFSGSVTSLVDRYASVWIDTGLIKVDKDEEMTVPLIENWYEHKVSQRPYACGLKDQRFIDEVFDNLHRQGRMEWVKQPTPFSAPVFVVWRTVDGKPKGRVVVDLRALNKVTMPDCYPLPRQEDIIGSLRGATHISAVDASAFFHQFGVTLEHRDRFTITSHRGLERSTVAPMGFRNSPAYAQRYMDRLLRPFRHFCRAFIDDVIIFSRSAEEHLRHLETILKTFTAKNISINPKKSWIGYPSAQVLGFRVDSLGLSTTAERVASFAKLDFPYQLSALEQYIGATGYIRHLIPYYAQLIEPLQRRKVALLAAGRQKGKVVDGNPSRRKAFTKATHYEPTEKERLSFQSVQAEISSGKGLCHLDPKKRLFLQLDGSLQRGFGAVLFHVKDGYIWKEGTLIPPNVVLPICFISKTLTGAESRYGPTELEVAALVWAVKRLKAHIGSSEGSLTVFTDHSATKPIVERTSLETSSTDRANRKLVNASIYLSEFNLRVFHIPGIKNFIPDALSRLSAPETDLNAVRHRPDYTALDDVLVSIETMISDETKARFQKGYLEDTKYKPVIQMLLNNTPDDPEITVERLNGEDAVEASKRGVPFALRQGLLYHEATDGYVRLCIPKAMTDDVLKMAHDDRHHYGVDRMTRELSNLAIPNLTYLIKKHIHGCKACCLGQTNRQQRIGNYLPIRPPVLPMQTITIDFITDMPPVESRGTPWALEGFDTFDQLLTVSCPASKRTLLIPGYATYSAANWATVLARQLLLADWGMPRVIISDRDRKFTSPFWRQLWAEFGTRLAMTTAYHPQADGLSERKNQTVEIAIRFYYIEHPHANWTHLLPSLQWSLNGALNAGTKMSAHEYIYGFRPQSALDAITPMEVTPDLPFLREAMRREAQLAMDFAAMRGKRAYDKNHKPIILKAGDRVYLRLHDGYHLPGKPSRKWSQQRSGPYEIIRMVGDLACELKLPQNMKIHPVISVQQLTPAHADDFEEDEPGPIEGGSDDEDGYVVDHIVKREVRRLGRKATPTEGFWVRWKGWGAQHDQWVKTADIAENLIEDFRKEHPEQFEEPTVRRNARRKVSKG
jgi:hypothetical protein